MEERKIPLQEIKVGEKTIYLLGTAHVSGESVKDVIYAIEKLKPQVVAIELDETRKKRLLKQDSYWQNLDMFKVIKQKKAMFLLSSIVLSSFQRRLGNNLSVSPGEEMLTALLESEKHNIPVILADRSAEVTLKRAWNSTSLWGRQKIMATLLSLVFTKQTISEEELEDLKNKSTQGKMMEELAQYLPNLKQVLVDERDEYLTINILNSEGDVLAVLGAAHVPGIVARIQRECLVESPAAEVPGSSSTDATPATTTEDAPTTEDSAPAHNDVDSKDNQPVVEAPQKKRKITLPSQEEYKARLERLDVMPRKKKINILGYAIPLVVLSLFGYGFYRGGMQSLSENFVQWWLINGGLSLIGACIALAHPATILLSFLAAPLTSLNPFIGVGIVTGLSETFFRKPRVKDFESLQDLSLSLKMLYKNRITRILIVVVTTTIGSAIGTFVGVSMLAANV